MQGLDYQVRIAFEDGEEEVNCFSSFEEADTAYTDRLRTEVEPCTIELVEVHVQHRIPPGGYRELDCAEPIICDGCRQEVEEIIRTNSQGIKQCSDCYLAEEGPQT